MCTAVLGFVVLVTNAAFEAVLHAFVEWVLVVMRITYRTVVQEEVELVLVKDVNVQLIIRWSCFAEHNRARAA